MRVNIGKSLTKCESKLIFPSEQYLLFFEQNYKLLTYLNIMLNRTIGVVQMVNKKIGPFTKGDEQAFETFAVYCGLALHHAKVRGFNSVAGPDIFYHLLEEG